MALDPFSEDCQPISKIAKKLPKIRKDKPPAPATVWRWATVGRRDPNGCLVKLETIKIGGVYMTSIEAVRRFIAALNDQEPATPAAPDREDEIEAELDRMGA